MKYWRSIRLTLKNPFQWGISLFFAVGVGAAGTWGNYGFFVGVGVWCLLMFGVFPPQTMMIWKEYEDFHQDKIKCPNCDGKGYILKGENNGD